MTFLDERGKPYQYIAIRADITARKAAEERLIQQAALAQVGQMAAVVAHEVRNPLAGIKGALQVLMSRRLAGDLDVPVMQDIVARINSLGELVDDLMLYARPRPPRPIDVHLHSIIADAITLVRRDPAGANITIAVDGDNALMRVDAELMRAALVNLLLNAAQAVGERGTVLVSTKIAASTVTVEIRDNGPGIPPDLRERVLEPFFTTKSRGGGLGLPIAKRSAELHGGSLTLSCPPDGGTVATLTLPMCAEARTSQSGT